MNCLRCGAAFAASGPLPTAYCSAGCEREAAPASIQRAREVLRFADECESRLDAMRLPKATAAVIRADIAATRASANALLSVRLAEFEGRQQ